MDDRDDRYDHRHRHLSPTAPGRGFGAAMGFARRTLAEWAGPGERRWADDGLLVACELLSNACRHTPGPTGIDLDLDQGRLTVSVSDPSSRPPAPQPARPARVDGHGLLIIDRLALGWGAVPRPGGKTVWATLPAPRPSCGPGGPC